MMLARHPVGTAAVSPELVAGTSRQGMAAKLNAATTRCRTTTIGTMRHQWFARKAAASSRQQAAQVALTTVGFLDPRTADLRDGTCGVCPLLSSFV